VRGAYTGLTETFGYQEMQAQGLNAWHREERAVKKVRKLFGGGNEGYPTRGLASALKAEKPGGGR